ncbi:hypothetical protein [Tenacibaculum singaporense]|uniref:hypothetical protein n=1 Tax=Tenacibaculum singaporense TaxID=2358479 RepID=UPI0035178499
MKTKIISFFLLLTTILSYSQEEEKEKSGNGKDLFSKVYTHYSEKRISYITLKDGTEITGHKRDVDRKKGQIYYIKIKNKETGKKFKFDSDQIKEMYLYPSGIQKAFKTLNHVYDARQWERSDLNNDVLRQGYIYFQNNKVSLKNRKKSKEYLMQLVNPSFAKYIEVYGDPRAKSTTRLGIGPISVAGGLAKSYYVKKNDEIFWLQKKNLKDNYDNLFGDCEEFKKKYPKKKLKWRYFSEYISEYTKMKSKA